MPDLAVALGYRLKVPCRLPQLTSSLDALEDHMGSKLKEALSDLVYD